jgi:Holliday junction resolvase-like predicted endonuclease
MGADQLVSSPGTGCRTRELAAAFLELAGRRIVNSGRPEAEIDLVADDAGTLLFVEVRSGTRVPSWRRLETITRRSAARL